MPGDDRRYFRFCSFQLDTVERELRYEGTLIPLTPKAFDTLAHLVSNSGHLVSKDELLSAVWPDTFVEEANLVRIVHTLRKTLSQFESKQTFIKTVPTRGYRFVADVVSANEEVERSKPIVPVLIPANGTRTNPIDDVQTFGPPAPLGRGRKLRQSIKALVAIAVGAFLVMLLVSRSGEFRDRSNGKSRGAGTENNEAYLSFREGRLQLEKARTQDSEKLLGYFDRAIELDPEFADAYAGRAAVKMFGRRTPDNIAQARWSINKALELDPNSSLAHLMQCRLMVTFDWDFEGASRACQRSIKLDPTSHEAHFEMAMMHSMFGRVEEALAGIDTAIALAPNSFNLRSRAWILFFARRYDEAIAQAEVISEDDGEFKVACSIIAKSAAMKGDHDKAARSYLRLYEADGLGSKELNALRTRYLTGGWRSFVEGLVKEIGRGKRFGSGGVSMAIHYLDLGEMEQVYENLETAIKERQVWMIHIGRWPQFDPIRGDPRFESLVARVGLDR
ncbi:MAG TPA: winged helix-turn-helix domain-containing protein [Pyrinomonadaceae bacterium]|nr:winged helix-turn-helix domain-containing protein [Pyrinomonadaceae bacterium]HMP64828.1 winged helix-turn-helix domain-containing protein [Pyrinomonadaceae bacterium]